MFICICGWERHSNTPPRSIPLPGLQFIYGLCWILRGLKVMWYGIPTVLSSEFTCAHTRWRSSTTRTSVKAYRNLRHSIVRKHHMLSITRNSESIQDSNSGKVEIPVSGPRLCPSLVGYFKACTRKLSEKENVGTSIITEQELTTWRDGEDDE